jgi:hypothetical protein
VLREAYCQGDNDDEPSLHGDGEEDESPSADRHLQDTEDDDKEQTQADGVTTECIFPNHILKQFPAGEVVEVLIGFRNQNPNAFHVEYIRGSLTSPVDFTYYIHNFTGSMYNTTVATEEEVSLIYRFKPDASIEPRQYGHILQVFYTNDDNETYLSTVFNGTIVITDPITNVDGKTIFAYLSIFGILAFGGFLLFKLIKKRAGKKFLRSTSKTTVAQEPATKTERSGIDWDYISEEHRQAISRNKGRVSPNTSPPRSRNSPVRKR